jgi:hypothetical protein
MSGSFENKMKPSLFDFLPTLLAWDSVKRQARARADENNWLANCLLASIAQ